MSVDGVVSAEVSFEDAQAIVRIRPDLVEGKDLVRVIQEAGFEAQVLEDTSGDPSGAARTGTEQR